MSRPVSENESGRADLVVRSAWCALALAGAAVWVYGPVSSWHTLSSTCHPDSRCAPYQLDPAALALLASHGLSLTAYLIYSAVVLAVVGLIWYGLGALIVWRRPTDRGAVLAAGFLAIIPTWESLAFLVSNAVSSSLSGIYVWALVLFCLLFPNGRFAARWTGWFAVGAAAFLLMTSLPIEWLVTSPLVIVMYLFLFVAVIAAQVYRYRSVSDWIERQQTKWGIAGLASGLIGIVTVWIVGGIASVPTGPGSLYGSLIQLTGTAIVLTAIPISLGFAVLRNGLWEIDRVINRALVYSVLSVSIAVIYAGSVIGLQALSRLVIGSDSALAIALSTLAIAALFVPLQRVIQRLIDRRFYRARYDASRTLAAFQDRLRDEVELERLADELVSVMQTTLQPAGVAVWFAPIYSPPRL